MRTDDRLHSLDALRAFALLAGIVLHSTMSFMPGLASAGFPADRSLSPALQVLFYVIHVFRMALFFFLAGYFAHLTFHQKGVAGFLRDRAKRIAGPLLVGWLLFGPAAMVLVYLAFGPPMESAPPGPPGRGVPLAHLWFLYYLLWFYAATIIGRTGVGIISRHVQLRARIDGWVRTLVQGHGAPVVLGAPIAMCLYLTPDWILWTGIASPDTGLTPHWAATTVLGMVFVFGWVLNRQAELLAVWTRRWAVHLGAAVALTALSLWLVERAPDPLAAGVSMRAAYSASYALAIWSWIFGLVGAAQRFCGRENAVRRYVADSSYWLYLAHLPLVFALQLLVRDWPLHWSVKFPSIVVVAVAILLVSYHYCVRSTWIGQVLNGRRYPRRAARSGVEGRPPLGVSRDPVRAGGR